MKGSQHDAYNQNGLGQGIAHELKTLMFLPILEGVHEQSDRVLKWA